MGWHYLTYVLKGLIIQKGAITKEEPYLHTFWTENFLRAARFPCIHIAGSDLSWVAHFYTCSCGTQTAQKTPVEGMLVYFLPSWIHGLFFFFFFQAASATQVFVMKASFWQLQFLKGTNYASSPASLPAMNAFRNQWSFHMADGSPELSST